MARKPKSPVAEERLRIEYVPLSKAVGWDWEENPKKHDIGGLIENIERHGFVDAPKFDAALGRFVYGNGRAQAVNQMHVNGYDRPRGIALDEETSQWLVPVKFGVDATSKREATALGISHNNLTLSGGDFGPLEIQRLWEQTEYAGVLADLAAHDELPVGIDGEDVDALIRQLADEGKPISTETVSFEASRGTQDKPSTFGVFIPCEGEPDQAQMVKRLRDEGYEAVAQGTKPAGCKR